MRRPLLLALLAGSPLVVLACQDEERPSSAAPAPTATATSVDPLTLASPFVGTSGFGFTFGSAFPGALAPQGLVKLGPDTTSGGGDFPFQHFSGYWYEDLNITAFSHLHLHGTGATDYGVLGVMPLDAFDASRISDDGHASPFRKETERASPGRYAVTLDRGNIAVELTASEHVAHHRYRYPDGAAPTLLLDLAHHLSGGTVENAEASASDGVVRGRLRHVGGMSGGFGGYDVFFVMKTSRPWQSVQVWSGQPTPAAGSSLTFTQPASDKQDPAGLALTFAPSAEPLELKVALSLVSAAGAEDNLAREDGSFDAVAQRTEQGWRPLVGAVSIEGSEEDQRQVASSLYHLYVMGSHVGDADGHYVGLDGKVHQAAGFSYCSDLSLWDTYRTLHPMVALLSPSRDLDMVRSLHAMARDGGYFPRWPIATGEAGTMCGASAEVVLADAYEKGIRDFDVAGAYAILRAAALDEVAPPGGRGGRGDADAYRQLGYVPRTIGGSVSKTIEYAYDDMALARLALAAGRADDAALLATRSQGWRKLYDPAVGFLRGHDAQGSMDAKKYSATTFGDDYVEASGWHTLFGPLHDVEGLIALHGSREALVDKLSTFFEQGRESYDQKPIDGSLKGGGMRPYFWASNEPPMHVAYLFAQAGRPDLTQRWVRWIQKTFFHPTPEGIPGNDDGGTMGAWYLFNAMGFYPVAGTDRYLVGAPTFARLTLHLAGGDFVIEAPGVSDTNLYVQSVELNGAPLTSPVLHHADLRPGGSLRFTMGPQPGPWATP